MKVFDSVPVKVPAKNVFNLSHDVKSSYNFDKLYPFLCQQVYPGDTWNARAEVFLRAMPLLCPVMHNVDMHIWFFFVPERLIWNENKKADFRTFITGGEDGKQTPTLPYFTYNLLRSVGQQLCEHGSLLDHMGFPTLQSADPAFRSGAVRISSLPFRAYQCVWNEYFRNQNVQNEIEFGYGAGQESAANIAKIFAFRKKCWEKDYFTSALPFQQRGQAMLLPIDFNREQASEVQAPVKVTTGSAPNSETTYGLIARGNSTGSPATVPLGIMGPGFVQNDAVELQGTATINAGDLTFTGLSVGTINDFRYCLRLQQWMENNARCGSRYIEQLFAHFGVRSSDARLQRPELLGGGKIPLIFSEIPQTSFGDGETIDVLGDLAGKGTLYGKTGGFKKFFEEHGVLLGILSIIPRTSYMQGIPRQWTAMTKEDWYWPEFAHLGEQAVLNKEVYYNPVEELSLDSGPDDVFGYQGRFTELRYIPSTVHGEMRNQLAYWHMGRIFTELPVLNASFVEAQTDPRCFSLVGVQQEGNDPFVCQIHMDIKAVRPMPKYAVPTL